MNRLRLCLVLALACALFSACGDSSDNASTNPSDTSSDMDAGPGADAGEDASEDASSEDTQPDAPEVATRTVLVPSASRVYPGWYTHDVAGELTSYSDVLGATPPVVFTFHDWNAAGTGSGELELQTFDAPLEGESDVTVLEGARNIAESGGILAIAWDAIGYIAAEPDYWARELTLATSFEALLAGEYDAYIRTCARQIKALGVPVMLSPFAEIDSITWFMFGPDELQPLEQVDDTRIHYGDPEVPDGPERLRDGYRHVVDIFREEEVDNVTWFIYAATGYTGRGDKTPQEFALIDEMHPRHFYPGDDYVDWIGTSVYLERGNGALEDQMRDQLQVGMDAWREVTDKPFFAPEFGVLAGGGDRSALLTEIVDALPDSGIDLVGFADGALYELIFDIPRLANSPDEAAAWRAVMSDPRYATELTFEQRP